MVDTEGRALILQVTPTSTQDRDGAVPLLQASRRAFPLIERVFADTAYAADRVANTTRVVVEIVRNLPGQAGFTVLPRRWVVERFFGWINRGRRLAKDFEATIESATAFLYAASVILLLRRIGGA
jgi:putative transposase